MAQQTITVDNTSGSPANVVMPGNTSSNPLFVSTALTPLANMYTSQTSEAAGTVAAKNYFSLFNPVGSGKQVQVTRIIIFAYSGGAATTTANLNFFRTSAASAGTQIAAANIGKYDTAQPNSVAEVRTANPTTTNTSVVPLLSVPPAITSAGSGINQPVVIVPPTGVAFVLRPGEGVVCGVSAGDVDQLFNVTFSWSEV